MTLAVAELSAAELQAWCDGHFTYRPGWRFVFAHHPFEGVRLRIECTVEDAYNPGSPVDLGIETFVPPLHDYGEAARWLVYRLARIETHECREWAKVDGRPLFDPHADD